MTGLYNDVTLAGWNEWRDADEGRRIDWAGIGDITDRTLEFAVALANAFGPQDDKHGHSHTEVVSWFMDDAINNLRYIPDGPLTVVRADATYGNWAQVAFINGFIFGVPDEEGDVFLEPLCELPTPDGVLHEPCESGCAAPAIYKDGDGVHMCANCLISTVEENTLALTTGSPSATLIARERHRQVSVEGYTTEHDDAHGAEPLIHAARSYATAAAIAVRNATLPPGMVPLTWPWHRSTWKPTGDAVRDLTKAGALIAAAIDTHLRKQGDAS